MFLQINYQDGQKLLEIISFLIKTFIIFTFSIHNCVIMRVYELEGIPNFNTNDLERLQLATPSCQLHKKTNPNKLVARQSLAIPWRPGLPAGRDGQHQQRAGL